MASLPLLLKLAEELGDDPCHGELNPRYYYMPRRYLHQHPPSHHHHHHFQHQSHVHPALHFPISSFNAILKGGKCDSDSDIKNVVSPVGKDGFQVCMDVQQFKPNELTVKTVDNSIIVEGKHEEREDKHGSISRHFVRRYLLPDGYDPNQVVSTLSSDGVLTVKVPPPPKPETGNERIVQIQQTGPAHLSVKENISKEEQKKGEDEKEKCVGVPLKPSTCVA